MTVLLKLGLKRFDVCWRKFANWHTTDPGDDLALDNLPMADRGFARNPSLNVNSEPMLKVFPNTHFGAIDVGPLVPAIEQSIEFSLGLTLGATKGYVARDPLSAGIPPKIKLQ